MSKHLNLIWGKETGVTQITLFTFYRNSLENLLLKKDNCFCGRLAGIFEITSMYLSRSEETLMHSFHLEVVQTS